MATLPGMMGMPDNEQAEPTPDSEQGPGDQAPPVPGSGMAGIPNAKQPAPATALDGLDTPDSAGLAQASDPDTQTFVMMVAGLREHVFGKGEAGIMRAMTQADDRGRVLGEIVFALVQEAAKQAKMAGNDLDMDILMGVATELIDDITELLAAHGITLQQKEREYGLLYAQQLYVENYNPSPDDRNAAKQQLAQYQQDGSLDTAVKYVQQRGTEEGTDPFGVAQMPGGPGMMQGK